MRRIIKGPKDPSHGHGLTSPIRTGYPVPVLETLPSSANRRIQALCSLLPAGTDTRVLPTGWQGAKHLVPDKMRLGAEQRAASLAFSLMLINEGGVRPGSQVSRVLVIPLVGMRWFTLSVDATDGSRDSARLHSFSCIQIYHPRFLKRDVPGQCVASRLYLQHQGSSGFGQGWN